MEPSARPGDRASCDCGASRRHTLTDAEIERAYLGLGRVLGEPVGQDRDANVLSHIIAMNGSPAAPGAAPHEPAPDFPQRRPGPRRPAVPEPARPAASPGSSAPTPSTTRCSAAQRIYSTMYQPMPWDRNDEQSIGEPPYFETAEESMRLPRLFLHRLVHPRPSVTRRRQRLTDEQRALRWIWSSPSPTIRRSTSRWSSSPAISSSSTTPRCCIPANMSTRTTGTPAPPVAALAGRRRPSRPRASRGGVPRGRSHSAQRYSSKPFWGAYHRPGR